MKNKFLFVDLSANTARPFDGMKAGKFTDMYGRGVEFASADMGAFLAGTKSAIEATKSETGVIVGLPVDMRNHEHGDAAGWIVGAELSGDVIRLSAKWTQVGLDLIGAGLQRFFSPSVDLANKAIIGGSLTNWPATRSGGKTLLRPIELSEGVFSLETSMDERLYGIYDAFDQSFNIEPAEGMPEVEYEVREVFDGYLIASEGEQLFRVTFTEAETGVTFQPQAEWVKVKITYEDIGTTEPTEEPATTEEPAPDAVPAEPVPAQASQSVDSPVNITELSEAQIAALVDERVNERLVELARKADRQRDTLAFSERVCNGTKENPIGLSVPPADLCEILLSMPEEHETKIRTLLDHVVKVGVVNFAERGHSQIVENRPELPAETKKQLEIWLNAGKSLADFFGKIQGVGSMADFNLSEYQGAK